MKSTKDFITERIDELALEYHDKFYCDLTKELQETIWSMAHRDYVGCWLDSIQDSLGVRDGSK